MNSLLLYGKVKLKYKFRSGKLETGFKRRRQTGTRCPCFWYR